MGVFPTSSAFIFREFKDHLQRLLFENTGIEFENDVFKVENFDSFPPAKIFDFVYRSVEIDWAFFALDTGLARDITEAKMKKFGERMSKFGQTMNMYFNEPKIIHSVTCDRRHLISNLFHNINTQLSSVSLIFLVTTSKFHDFLYIFLSNFLINLIFVFL